MNNKYKLVGVLLILAFTITLLTPITQLVYSQAQKTPPRNETLVVGGGLWSPPTNFNPLVPWAATTGTIGLIYETLYLYIPNLNKWVPWLAESMPKWLNSTTLEIKLRNAWWWDGQKLTSKDVKFTFYDLPKELPSLYYSSILSYLIKVSTPDNRTVIFYFNKTTINYPQIAYYLYSIPIVPEHIFEPIVKKEGAKILQLQVVGASKPEDIVGSGMYKVYFTTSDTVYYVRVDNWWGKNVFGLPAPKYIKYIMVFSNQVALGMLLRGDLDWSNYFIPGIPQLIKRYSFLVTFYRHKPYYLPANVAYLFINTQKPPLNDPRFRKALYYAIDINKIINEVYGGAVLKSNAVGLIPIPGWKEYIAQDLLQKYNYTYNPEKAKKLLDEAGYIDRNGDGWRDLPNGKTIELTIIVPYGWTDWMQAAILIANDLKAIGIKTEVSFPAYGVYADKMYKGDFDLLINNFGSFVSPTPYTLYNWLLWQDAPPEGKYSWSGNFGRYYNSKVRELLQEIAHTPLSDTTKLKQLYRQLEEILLQEMPYIPLWYNPYWFQATTFYWKGWPTENNPYGVPVTWPGRWQDGGLLVLLHLKPVKTSTVTTTTSTTSTSSTTTTRSTTTSRTRSSAQTPITSSSTTTSTTATSTTTTSSHVSAGLIAGIVIVVVVVVGVAVALLRRG